MDRTKQYIIPACFIILPFIVFLASTLPGAKIPSIHISHHYAFTILGLIVSITLIKNEWLSAFAVYCALWTGFVLAYIAKFPIVPMVIAQMAFNAMMYVFISIIIFSAVTRSKLHNETFYNYICVSALIGAALGILQRVGIDPVLWILNYCWMRTESLSTIDSRAMTGLFGNNNFLAAYLAISLPFFFRCKWYYGLIAVVPVLYFCKTTSAMIPAIVGACFFFYPILSIKWRVVSVLGAVSAGTLYAFFDHSPIHTNPRWSDWWFALDQIRFNIYTLIFGMGPGSGWGKTYPMHNEWLQCFHQYGAIGLSMMIGFVVTVCRRNRIIFTAFLIAAINMFGNYSLHLSPSAFLIILIAGLLERERITANG